MFEMTGSTLQKHTKQEILLIYFWQTGQLDLYSKVWSAMYENQKTQKLYVFMYIEYWVKTGQYVQYSQNK